MIHALFIQYLVRNKIIIFECTIVIKNVDDFHVNYTAGFLRKYHLSAYFLTI